MRIPPHTRSLINTVIGAALLTLLLCARSAGFMVIFECLFIAPWLAYSLWIIYRHPERRRLQALQVGCWLLSITVIALVHLHLAATSRAYAQTIADAVARYNTDNGHYPADLQAIGYRRDTIRARLGMANYSLEHGEPLLFYADTFTAFQTYSYDFGSGKWDLSD